MLADATQILHINGGTVAFKCLPPRTAVLNLEVTTPLEVIADIHIMIPNSSKTTVMK